MKRLIIITLLALPLIASAQEVTNEANVGAYKHAVSNARDQRDQCENRLAVAMDKIDDMARLQHEFDKMKRDYENVKKQLEEKGNASKEGQVKESN